MIQGSVGIVGAGLAGCEAALVLAQKGLQVHLYEMRPRVNTEAHTTDLPAELVCSNSFKSQDLPAAQALLKHELSLLNSPLVSCARASSVRAGMALAVDRLAFSQAVATALKNQPTITYTIGEVTAPPTGHDAVIIATGPLSSPAITQWLIQTTSAESLYFYDAIAPIVSADSINMDKAFLASRWGKGTADYCNCPFTEEEYKRLYDALIAAEKTPARNFEKEQFFEACLPIEVIASRGYQAMSFGPLKPVGLDDPRTGRWPYAVLQLRRENENGDSYSLVAFQTRMTIPEQKRVFTLIPGLENAEFLRYGSCHRNTYLNAPKHLEKNLSFRDKPDIFCAGQLCGNEGYSESIATGHMAALFVENKIKGKDTAFPPLETALGALHNHVTASLVTPFVPSSFHFGLLPALTVEGRKKIPKKEKHELLCKRAIGKMEDWIGENGMRM